MRQNIFQPLRIRTVNARPEAHSRLERRAASAGRFVRTTQPTSCMFVVRYTGDACAQLASAGLRLESRRWWHVCAVPPRSCDSDHDCSPEWPPRASVWHETRTRAAGMHAEYVWPCYAAQLRRCPRVSACVPDWVCLQASCSADSQKISLLGSSVGGSGARAVLLINARRSVRPACSHTHRGISFKIVSGGVGCWLVAYL